VLNPELEGSTVEYRAPEPKRLPEQLTDRDMQYLARDYDKPNSPSSRQRMREEVAKLKERRPDVTDKQIREAMDAAHKDGTLITRYADEKKPEAKAHPQGVVRDAGGNSVYYPDRVEVPSGSEQP
jgi:hypothetical protein